MVIKGIVFDLFGVLVLPGYETLLKKRPDLSSEIDKIMSQGDDGLMSRRQLYESLANLAGITAEEVRAYHQRDYVKDEEAINWVREIKKSKKFKLSMLSNVAHGWVEDFFDKAELDELFDDVVLSSDIGLSKPSPRVFDITAERLDLAPVECIMIDDKSANIDGAKEAGMKGIVYTSLDQAKSELQALLG